MTPMLKEALSDQFLTEARKIHELTVNLTDRASQIIVGYLS